MFDKSPDYMQKFHHQQRLWKSYKKKYKMCLFYTVTVVILTVISVISTNTVFGRK